jgi:hypothetical protein
METVLRNVKDIARDDREGLEHLVGASLQENQQVLIHILDIGIVPTDSVRGAAIEQAAALAEQGRRHAASQGITPEESDEAIDEAINWARRERRA